MSNKIVSYISKNMQVKSTSRMEREKMERLLRNAVDDLIREYKENTPDGYKLDPVDDLPDHAKSSFIDILYNLDPIIKAEINELMRMAIEERITIVECEDMYEKGLSPLQDSVNGEFRWVRR